MIVMTSLILGALIALAPAPAQPDELKSFFGYFLKGDKAGPTDPVESKKMLEGHLKNLTTIMLENNGLAAGPLQDPTQIRRGIIAFQAKSEEEAMKHFANDPFVKNGIMTVKLYEWNVDPAKFTVKKADPNALTEYCLVILTPGKSMQPVNEARMKDHQTYMKGLSHTHHMRVVGDIKGPTKIREVAIFETKDTKGIEEALKNDPLVKSSLLEVEIIPLWMSKGIFGP